jgi:hypothetical protein
LSPGFIDLDEYKATKKSDPEPVDDADPVSNDPADFARKRR